MLLSAAACGALLFPGLYLGLTRFFRSFFPGWSEADVVCVSERLVSALHGALAFAAGVAIVTSCNDVMNDRHWLADSFAVFGAPYMTFDLVAMYLSHFHSQRGAPSPGHGLQSVRAFLRKDWLLVLHHTALLGVFLPVTLLLRRGLGDFFVGCFFISELSTPFISIGKILIQRGLDSSLWHRLNGLAVLLTFFSCRILLFPFMYWSYGRQTGVPLHRVPFHLPPHCNLGNAVILAPQVHWFILLLKKARRLYRRQRDEKLKD